MFRTLASILDLKYLWSLPSFGSTFLSFQTTTQAKLLLRIFFGKQQLTNGLDKEGDLMRFNTNKIILYEV